MITWENDPICFLVSFHAVLLDVGTSAVPILCTALNTTATIVAIDNDEEDDGNID